MKFLEKYYPIILAFLSFLYSVYLWFTGNELEGICGASPITILGFTVAIRQKKKPINHDYASTTNILIGSIVFLFTFFYKNSDSTAEKNENDENYHYDSNDFDGMGSEAEYLTKSLKTEL